MSMTFSLGHFFQARYALVGLTKSSPSDIEALLVSTWKPVPLYLVTSTFSPMVPVKRLLLKNSGPSTEFKLPFA